MRLRCQTMLAGGLLLAALAGAAAGQVVTARDEPLLAPYDASAREYLKLQIDNVVSYFHQRMAGEAIVERDFVRYRIDAGTGALLEHTVHWRPDVPAGVTPLVTRAEAEAAVLGTVVGSRLWIIAPDSDVFPLRPPPPGPCWVVRSIVDDRLVVSILDALTGDFLGLGIPPPYEGFSLGGPDWGACAPFYTAWAQNAETWFEAMGYDTEMVDCPPDAKVQSHVQSDSTAMFYELAHGDSGSFHNICPDSESITAAEVETWIADYAPIVFVFLGSCGGMCDQGDNRLSFEFRKNDTFGTAAVGYCGMDSTGCDTCWSYSIPWQTVLFDWMESGATVQTAFNQANLAYPGCATGNCTRIAGDTGLNVVPVLRRSICGNVWDGWIGPFTSLERPYFIRCNSTVPAGQTLTVGAGATVAFLNDARLRADGTLTAGGGNIRFISEAQNDRGLRLSGQMKLYSGGAVRVRE